MQRIRDIWHLLLNCGKWFHRTTIATNEQGERPAPIRYDGDPTDIYLA